MLESKPNSRDTARSALARRQHLLDFQSAISTPDRCSFPVIAACHGHVIGLGIDIIAACDIRYAATKTTFSIKASRYHSNMLYTFVDVHAGSGNRLST